MSENTELLKRIEKLVSWKKSKAFMADKLGISEKEVTTLLEELRGGGDEPELAERTVEYNEEKGTLKSSVEASFEPKTHEELAELHRVDLTKYKISSYWTKQRGDKFTSSLLCSLIKPSEFDPEKFADFLKGYKPPRVKVEIKRGKADREVVDVEISIADFHLDRKTLQEDSLENRKKEFLSTLLYLVDCATSTYEVDRFAFVIGNDFFNSDNYQGSTTNLTPQDNLVTFNESYEAGFDLLVQAISILKEVSKSVEVILIQGNHDRTKSYYLAHALDVFFSEEDSIYFDRCHSTIKHTILGNTFIGYHHGNCKIDELPLVFATGRDTAEDFGLSPYREVHTADKHFYLAKEIKGVRVQQIPSMANPDKWSNDHNFVNNIRAGLALVYHPIRGKIAEFEGRVEL